MSEKKQHITSIGGQAIIEGVMMRGPHKTAMAVRKSDGDIAVEVNDNGTKKKNAFFRLPIVRGCVNFFESMIIGMKALMFSAEFMDLEDDEPSESKFDKWLEDKFGDKIKDIVIYVSLVVSLFLSVGLFIVLPNLVTSGIDKLFSMNFIPANVTELTKTKTFYNIVEAVIKLVIFLSYLALISNMKDIRRVFEYHGAEHKTIFCYESGEPLTVENVKKQSRFHPRCGTNFLFFTIIISIIVFCCLPKFESNVIGIILRVVSRLLLMPVVAGLSYEVIKLAGKSENKAVKLLTKPGLWLQRLTTREPDDSQIEVAIKSIENVIPENKEDDKW